MLKGKRVRRKTTTKSLAIRNPYQTTSYNRYKLNREFVSPLKGRYGDPISKLGIDQEKLKKMQKLGMIPDTLGVQMREYTGNSTATSQGVSSLQALSDEQDLAHQVQMFNAGILSKKQQKLKSLLELAKKKKKYDFDKKVVEWLATAKEIEQVPPELIEDVRKYWRNEASKRPGIGNEEGRIVQYIEDNMTRVAGERREYAQQKLEEKERKGRLRGFFEQPRFNTLQPSTATSLRYSDNSGLLSVATPPFYTQEERRRIWELHKNDDDMFQRANAFNIYTSGMSPQQRYDELQRYVRSFQPNNSDMARKFGQALNRLQPANRRLPLPPSHPPPPPPPRRPQAQPQPPARQQPQAQPPSRQQPQPELDPVTDLINKLTTDPKSGVKAFFSPNVPASVRTTVINNLHKVRPSTLRKIQNAFRNQGKDLIKDYGFNMALYQSDQSEIRDLIQDIKDKIRRFPTPSAEYAYYQNLGNTFRQRYSADQLRQIRDELNTQRFKWGDLIFDTVERIPHIDRLAEQNPTDVDMIQNITWFYNRFKRDPNLMRLVLFPQFDSLPDTTINFVFPGLDDSLKQLYNDYKGNSSAALQQDEPMEVDIDVPPQSSAPQPSVPKKPAITSVDVTEDAELPDDTGSGYLGWRAPRLHKLVRPYKPFMLTETPEDIIEGEKHDLDDRRAMYKDQQLLQRGLTPPKDMVDRAMPKTAKPFLHNPLSIPFTGVVPHPFVFPDKKYFIRPGL